MSPSEVMIGYPYKNNVSENRIAKSAVKSYRLICSDLCLSGSTDVILW